MEVYSRTKLYI